MKSLKKILVAIAVVALLISSVVVMVATAEDVAYTGELSAAQELLDAVPRNHVYNGRLALQKVYDYLKATPVDPSTAGYTEFEAELNQVALWILNEYHNKYLEGGEVTDFELVYSLIATYGIPDNTPVPTPDTEGKEYIDVVEIKRSIETSSMAYAKAYYDKALEAHTGKDISTSTKQLKALYEHIAEFPVSALVAEFETFCKSYNELSLQITEGIVSELNTLRDAMNADGAGDTEKQAYKDRLATLLTIVRDHNKDSSVDTVRFPELKTRFDAYISAMVFFEFDQISFLFEDYEAKDFYEKDSEGNHVYDFPELAEAAALSSVSAALKASSVPETTEGYAELVEKITAEEIKVAKIKEDRRKALSDATPLEQFSLTSNIITNDYNDTSVAKYINHMHNSDNNKGQYKAYDSANPKEMYWNYYSLGSPNTSAYTEIYVRNKSNSNAIKNGFVMSFDFMVENTNPNGGHYSKAAFSLRFKKNDTGSIVLADGSNVAFGTTLFTIEYDSATDALKVYNTKQDAIPVATTRYNVAAEGQWFNLMVTYDPETRYGKLYIDYQEMFEIYYQVKPGKDELPSNAGVGEFRVSQSSAAWNNMNFDNFMKYEGTEYRELDKFDGMEEYQLFMYYVDFLTGDVASLENKYFCYTAAKDIVKYMKELYDGYTEEDMVGELAYLKDLKASVEKFEKYEAEKYKVELLPNLIAEKTAEYGEMVADVLQYKIDSANIEKINKAMSMLDSFVAEYIDFIDTTSETYTKGVAEISKAKLLITACDNAVDFARGLTLFNRATTVASMQKRADALAAIYKAARYDKPENREAISTDTAVVAFEKTINPEGLTSEDEEYITMFDYYSNYISKIIAERQKIENSTRIVKCMELLLAMEGYKDTEAFWGANIEEVEFYIAVVRDIVSANNYDPAIEGVSEAILQYELVDAFLYKELQKDHIAAIGAELDKFQKSESYIEKRGICTYVNKYFEDNTNIDLSLPEIIEFKRRLEIYETELSVFAKDFEAILKRNSQYFIDTVKKMEGLTTYAELKPIYDQALSYYYVMNVTDEQDAAFAKSIEDAIALFDVYDKRITAIEVNTELFLKSIVDIDLLIDVGMGLKLEFQILSEAAPYYEYLDMTYVELMYGVPEEDEAAEGETENENTDVTVDSETDTETEEPEVDKEAEKRKEYERLIKWIGIYEKAYNDYNTAADSVNSASRESVNLSVALASEGIPVAILAVLGQLVK